MPLFIAGCNNQPEQTKSIVFKKAKMAQKHLQDSLQSERKVKNQVNQIVNRFYQTVDSLKLEKGMFPVEDYIYDTTAGDGYHYALFYLKFMAAAKARDKARITALIHFPFQTTKEKLKYIPKDHDYEVVGAENWKGGLMDEAQFSASYSKIFTDEILENIPETRPKDTQGGLPGDVRPQNDYDSQLQAFTDKGSNMYAVSIELPVKKRKYNYVHFNFGRINGDYKVLSYFLE